MPSRANKIALVALLVLACLALLAAYASSAFIIPLCLLCLIAVIAFSGYQLINGFRMGTVAVGNKGFATTVSRKKNPAFFWLAIWGYLIVFGACVSIVRMLFADS